MKDEQWKKIWCEVGNCEIKTNPKKLLAGLEQKCLELEKNMLKADKSNVGAALLILFLLPIAISIENSWYIKLGYIVLCIWGCSVIYFIFKTRQIYPDKSYFLDFKQQLAVSLEKVSEHIQLLKTMLWNLIPMALGSILVIIGSVPSSSGFFYLGISGAILLYPLLILLGRRELKDLCKIRDELQATFQLLDC